jgi:hypothetical protein
VFVGPSREIIAAFGAESVAAPISASALVDTGAASTVIAPDVVRLLRLRTVGGAFVHTPTSVEPVLCRQFHLNVYFSPEFVVEDILALEAPLSGQPVQCLIGRDVLSRGVLTYSGIESRFRLSF